MARYLVVKRSGVAPPELTWIANQPSYLPIIPRLAGWGVETPAGSGRHLGTPSTSLVFVDRMSSSASDGAQVSPASGNQPAVYRGGHRYASERTFPCVIVYEISGMYDMQRTQLVDSPYKTFAFHTAPSPGFFIKNGNMQVRANDVLLWHMQVYNGDETSAQDILVRRGFTFGSGLASPPQRCVLAWCSMYWSSDGIVAATQGGTDFTLAHCILAEGLANPLHPEYPHSQSLVLDSETNRISMQRCLMTHSRSRNPLCRILNFAMVNCVSYNCKGAANLTGSPGSFGCDFQGNSGTDTLNNVIGNYFIKGPNFSSTSGGLLPMYARGTDNPSGFALGSNARLYLSFNIAHGWTYAAQADLLTLEGTPPSGLLAAARIDASWPDGFRGMDPAQVGYLALCQSTIGARPLERAAGRDALMWTHVTNRVAGAGPQGNIIETTSEVGGAFSVPVTTRSLLDPVAMSGDPLPLSNFNALSASGYTLGEEWLYRQHLRVTPAL